MILSLDLSSSGHPASPDIYFSAGYGHVSEIETGGRWLLLTDSVGTWQVPVMLTPIDGTPGWYDAASPYGYSGVYASNSLDRATQDRLWEQTLGHLKELGAVSLFLRHSPLVSLFDAAAADDDCVRVVSGHPTVAVDVAGEDEMWANLQGRTRTAIRKAAKSNLQARVRAASADDCRDDSQFRALYESTMKRVGASQRYFFDRRYYEALVHDLENDLFVVEVFDDRGVTGGAALLMRHQALLHYHLSGSAPEQARLGGNNLLIWTAMQWARDAGVERFHLGGGVSADDPLLRFKQSFGGNVLNYAATGHILDPAKYEQLLEQRSGPPTPTTSHFFPAYRARVS